MISILKFFAVYNSYIITKKKKNRVEHSKKVEEVLKILVKLNIIAWYSTEQVLKIKYVVFKIKKFKKIVPLWTQQKITITVKELCKLDKMRRTYYIISNDKGIQLLSPYDKKTQGGLIIAKIKL